MVGQPLGGALFGIARSVPFLLDAVSYVVSLATLLLIKAKFQVARKAAAPGAGRPGTAMLRDIREGAAWLWDQPFLRVTTFLIAGSGLSGWICANPPCRAIERARQNRESAFVPQADAAS